MTTYIGQQPIPQSCLDILMKARPDVMYANSSPGYHNPTWTVQQMYYDWWYNIKPPEYLTFNGDISAYCKSLGGGGISIPMLVIGAGLTVGAIWFMAGRRKV